MDAQRAHALSLLTARRWQIAIALTITMLFIYFGFVLLIAFDKPLLAVRVAPGLSLGILLGVLVILSAWVLTLIYVRWANRGYDIAVDGQKGQQQDRQAEKTP